MTSLLKEFVNEIGILTIFPVYLLSNDDQFSGCIFDLVIFVGYQEVYCP